MLMKTETRYARRAAAPGWGRVMDGAVTVVAFTESGRMHRLRVAKRLMLLVTLLTVVLLVGSTTSVLRLFRGQVDLARMAYLERENQSLTSLLEGQAEQLSRLKVEVARLKEFEQNLRVVSGMDAQTDAPVGTGQTTQTGQTRATKREAPRKR
jgi:Tfp pilus assembly protein PilN